LKRKSLSDDTIFELAKLYQDAALQHGHGLDTGDSKTANKQYHALRAIEKELRRRGSDGFALFVNLMHHEAPWVRLAAAAYGLRFAPAQAETVLQELVSLSGTCGFTAEMTLAEWRKGNLKFEE